MAKEEKNALTQTDRIPVRETATQAMDTSSTASHVGGTRTESIPISTLARLSATARFRIFPGERDMDSEILESETPKNIPQIISSPDDKSKMILFSDQYNPGLPFAAGGHGILRTATDRKLHRLVAIKTLRKEFEKDPEQRRAFLKEAEITAQLDHPAVIPIYSMNTDEDDNLYLSMKYIKGHTFQYYLEQVVRQYSEKGISHFNSRKALFSRLELFLRVCDAMEYAHSRNIMHCDLKPENIMIGEYREVYVMDWGIARPIRNLEINPEKWVRPEKITGTPRYISPEAVAGEYCDERSDIYSLGLILFETVTLTDSVIGDTRDIMLSNIQQGKLAPLRHRFGIMIHPDLKAIIRKATARDFQLRYSSVSDLADDVRRFLRNEEVRARPNRFFGKIVRSCSRHPGSALLAAFSILVVAGAVLTFTLVHELFSQNVRSKREADSLEAYVRSFSSAREIDRQIFQHAQILDSIVRNVLFLQSAEHLSAPADRTDAPVSAFLSPDDPFTPGQNRSREILQMLAPVMDDVLSRGSESFRTENRLSSVPVRHIFFAFHNGLLAVHPSDDEAAELLKAPETQDWFQEALRSPRADASVFVFSRRQNRLRLFCVRRIERKTETEQGLSVAALELDPECFFRNMSVRHLEENETGRYLLDSEGRILLTNNELLQPSENAPLPEFPWPGVWQKIKKSRNGSQILSADGKRKLWCFHQIPATDWFWVEQPGQGAAPVSGQEGMPLFF